MARPRKAPHVKQAANGYWYLYYHDGERSQRKSLETKDHAQAQFALGEFLSKPYAGNTDKNPALKPLLDSWERSYIDSPASKLSSPETLRTKLNNIRAYFCTTHNAHLKDVTRLADEYTVYRLATVSSGRARDELKCLLSALNWHCKREHIDKVPFMEMPEENAPRDYYLTRQQREHLIRVARHERIRRVKPTDYDAAREAGLRTWADYIKRMEPITPLSRTELFCWIAFECGQRKTVIQELEWDRVDPINNLIDFHPPGKKRTSKKAPVVPISARLRPVLRRAWKERENDLVLFNTGDVRTTIDTLSNKAGMPDVTPHVFRHTAATHMAQSGVPLWHIAGVLGNSVAMVEKVYAKHCPDNLRRAVDYDWDR